jgi:hypothetical protein
MTVYSTVRFPHSIHTCNNKALPHQFSAPFAPWRDTLAVHNLHFRLHTHIFLTNPKVDIARILKMLSNKSQNIDVNKY